MSWERRLAEIQTGDTVRFSRRWLKENDRADTYLAWAKGVITGIEESDGRKLASVRWNQTEMPDQVNVLNLAKVRQRGVE